MDCVYRRKTSAIKLLNLLVLPRVTDKIPIAKFSFDLDLTKSFPFSAATSWKNTLQTSRGAHTRVLHIIQAAPVPHVIIQRPPQPPVSLCSLLVACAFCVPPNPICLLIHVGKENSESVSNLESTINPVSGIRKGKRAQLSGVKPCIQIFIKIYFICH